MKTFKEFLNEGVATASYTKINFEPKAIFDFLQNCNSNAKVVAIVGNEKPSGFAVDKSTDGGAYFESTNRVSSVRNVIKSMIDEGIDDWTNQDTATAFDNATFNTVNIANKGNEVILNFTKSDLNLDFEWLYDGVIDNVDGDENYDENGNLTFDGLLSYIEYGMQDSGDEILENWWEIYNGTMEMVKRLGINFDFRNAMKKFWNAKH